MFTRVGWILWWTLYVSLLATRTVYTITITGGADVTSCDLVDAYYEIVMMENNHNFTDQKHLFTITDVTQMPNIKLVVGSFDYNLVKIDQDQVYNFYAKQSFDYENSNQKSFNILVESTSVAISVDNYDDESPTLTNPWCSMKENWDYVQANTTCIATLEDTDGWITQTTFKIVNSNPSATDIYEQEDQLFEFDIDRSLNDTVYSATVWITTKHQLDYEKKIFYSFDVIAKDGAGHPTTPNENVRCVINVDDENDTPPQFTDYFTSKQIDEKTEYTNFSVKAVDGDKGRDKDIFYYILPVDSKEAEDPYISIDKTTGALLIKPIDRDADDLITYSFEIKAVKDDKPPLSDTIRVTLFLTDLDDNSPLVMSLVNASGEIIDYSNMTNKAVHFWFLENFAGTLDGTMTITDIDTGGNALFNVVLEDDPSSTETFTEAFFIVPTAGYRTADFKISVRNATKLDYENPPWDNFNLIVHSTGQLDPALEDRLLIEISLIDYNDEVPKFDKEEYTVEIRETIKKGEQIIQVKATDRDKEDETLKHALIGSTTITRTMDIDRIEGVITVAIDDAFDYDRINPVFFQVSATDHADPPHTTTVPVTVTLLDVNNKAPTYISKDRIEVEENQVIGIKLNTTITASDVDTTRDLSAEIDWAQSYVLKNSLKLDSEDAKIKDAMRFVDLKYELVDDSTNSDGSIAIYLVVNDVNDAETAPDYETFDTLYLTIIITDWNTELPEFKHQMNTTAVIPISIIDINDNKPIFTPETLKANRTVEEEARAGVLVGTIVATDADVGDIVTYSCTFIDEAYDWFEASETGMITVKANSNIDCDTDDILSVPINCSATDTLHYTYQQFDIYILDTNKKIPQHDVNGSSATEVFIEELSPEGTPVTLINYTDGDRDIPFKTAMCTLDDYGTECYSTFETTDNFVVVKKGAQLNRDTGTRVYTCNFTCTDNIRNFEGRGQNSNGSTFDITLLDINNNCPELQTTDTLVTFENLPKGEKIAYIQAKDIDEGVNADIDFKILTVTKDGVLMDNDLFDLVEVDGEYYVSETIKQNTLKTKKDLRELYGTYILQLELSDRGVPQQSTDSAKLTVVVKKYNYYQPIFTFPENSSSAATTFSLSMDQEDDTQLHLYNGNKDLQNFQILNVENKCSDKWDPKFTLDQTKPETSTFFKIHKSDQDRCSAQLQVHNYDKAQAKSTINYKLTITATLADVDELQPDEQPYYTSIDISIIFVDFDQDPIFDDPDKPCVLYFIQDRYDTDNTTAPLDRSAYYPNGVRDWSIYYFIVTDDENVKQTFNVNRDTGDVSLKRKLYYNEQKVYTFQILASRNTSATSSNISYLIIDVNVVDSNIHAPQWTQTNYFGAIMKNTILGTVVVTAEATDEDEIDQGKLKYSIDGDIKPVGESISGIPEAFKMDENSGDVTLNFPVDYNMNGYFEFTAKVEDNPDPYDNPAHESTTKVTVYIVTDDNTANFNFENSLADVTTNRVAILEIISGYLGWNCYDQNIQRASQNGQELTNVTVASIYCVDNNELKTEKEILNKMSNLATFLNLRKELSATLGIWLQSFTQDTPVSSNLEQMLKTALIVVAVVLGTICLILALTFFLKIRTLNRRLERLTEQKFGSDESSINRKAINAPTTNMFAAEGSNPVYNNELVKEDLMYDKQSLRSDDSGDLIGVEDNPEFDMFGENRERF